MLIISTILIQGTNKSNTLYGKFKNRPFRRNFEQGLISKRFSGLNPGQDLLVHIGSNCLSFGKIASTGYDGKAPCLPSIKKPIADVVQSVNERVILILKDMEVKAEIFAACTTTSDFKEGTTASIAKDKHIFISE